MIDFFPIFFFHITIPFLNMFSVYDQKWRRYSNNWTPSNATLIYLPLLSFISSQSSLFNSAPCFLQSSSVSLCKSYTLYKTGFIILLSNFIVFRPLQQMTLAFISTANQSRPSPLVSWHDKKTIPALWLESESLLTITFENTEIVYCYV